MICKILNYNCPCCLENGQCLLTFPASPARCDYRGYEEEDVQALMDLVNFVVKRMDR